MENGEAYWHRTHQIPGLLFCPNHETSIVETDAPYVIHRLNEWADANDAALAESNTSCLTPTQAARALEISKHLAKTLNGELDIHVDRTIYYMLLAVDGGLCKSTRMLPVTIIDEFYDYYSGTLLDLLGLPKLERDRSCWIFKCINNRDYGHPLQHAAIEVFLNDVAKKRKILVDVGFGPFKCLNQRCHKDNGLATARIVAADCWPSGLRITAKCSCGFAFSFSKTNVADKLSPGDYQIESTSPSWRREVLSLHADGKSAPRIAEILEVDSQTIRKTIGENYPYCTALDERKRVLLREQWKAAYAMYGGVLSDAKSAYYILHKTLEISDNHWLTTYNRKHANWNIASSPNIDDRHLPLNELDERWSKRIDAVVAFQIAHPLSLRPMTYTEIAEEASLKYKYIKYLGKASLPKTFISLKLGRLKLSIR